MTSSALSAARGWSAVLVTGEVNRPVSCQVNCR
jgi:hypothetical protein